MKRLTEKLLTLVGFGPSDIPLRWRVRWFLMGMRSVLIPYSLEELRRELDACVEEQMKKWREQNPPPDHET